MTAHIDPEKWKKQRKKRLTVLLVCLAVLAFAVSFCFLLTRRILPASVYRKAEEAYEAGRLSQAIDLFASEGRYRDADIRASELAFGAQKDRSMANVLKNAQPGDLVSFGIYEQNGDPEDGDEPILWRVIRKDSSRILLLSEYVLEEKLYHDAFEEVSWDRCSLRAWANGPFLESAFSEPERLLIVNAALKNGGNPVSGVGGGPDTSDRIFLLSVDELIAAASESDLDVFSLEAEATKSAAANGLETDPWTGVCCWWLRTPGKTPEFVIYADMSGSILHYTRPNRPGYGFRPALWVFSPE